MGEKIGGGGGAKVDAKLFAFSARTSSYGGAYAISCWGHEGIFVRVYES